MSEFRRVLRVLKTSFQRVIFGAVSYKIMVQEALNAHHPLMQYLSVGSRADPVFFFLTHRVTKSRFVLVVSVPVEARSAASYSQEIHNKKQ